VFSFCFSPSCLSYVTSLSVFYCVFAFFFSVLSTLCYQFLWIVLFFCFVSPVFSTLCCQFLRIVLCFCFASLRLVYPMLPVSLDCVVFSFCFSPSCLPYVASFSGLCCVFVLFLSVFSTLCCQFLWIVLCFRFVSLRLFYPMLPVCLYCIVFLLFFSPSCLRYVTSFSGLCFVFVLFRETKQKHSTIQRNWQHRVDKTERNKAKTQHNPEKLAT
jgi:hypothetical protein